MKFAILLLALPLWAHTSLDVNATSGTVTLGSIPQGDMHWDVWVHNYTLPVSGQTTYATFGGFSLRLSADNTIYLSDAVDTFTGPNPYINIAIPAGVSTTTGFLVRAQRCTASTTASCTWIGGPFLELEDWNIDGTGYTSGVSQITTVNALTSGAVTIGNIGNLTAKLAYARWCQGTTPMNVIPGAPTIPPWPNNNTAQATCTPIADWEFETGSFGTDIANGHNLTISGSSTPFATPTPNPGCALPPTSFSTNSTATVSAAYCGSLQDSATLTYAWTYLGAGSDGVTQTPTFTTASSQTSTVTGLARGSFNIQVVVTDSAMQATTAQVHDGVVVADSNHVVNSMGTSSIDELYMPMIQWGYNPYLYFDYSAKVVADYMGSLQATTFLDTWNTRLSSPATVSCTNGTTTCTTSTTVAQTDFCNGTSSGGTNYLIVWNTISAVTYRSEYSVSACPTSSTVTISPAYRDTTASGMSFSTMIQGGTGAGADTWWEDPSNNANYYDNVVAFLALYYRSGIDTYYTYGHTLGTRWWSNPFLNQGLSCNSAGGYPCLATVSARDATLGLVTLYLDGTIPTFLTQTEIYWQAYDAAAAPTSSPLDDLRVSSMILARLSYWSMLESGTNQTNALTALGNSVAFLRSIQGVDGSIINLSFGTAPWNGNAPGTATVTNSSTSVTGSGTNWNSVSMSGNYFETLGTNSPTCVQAHDLWDATPPFAPTVNSDTSLTISPAYNGGQAGSGRYWQVGNVVGCGEQPFMAGFDAHAMYLANLALTGHDATNAAKAKAIVLANAGFIENSGYTGAIASPPVSGINGIVYGLLFAQDVPNPWADQGNLGPCGSGLPTQLDCNIQGIRFLGAETMSALGYARLMGDTSAIPSTLYSAMYGGLGGGGSADGHYVWQYFSSPQGSGEAISNKKPKDFGFGMGWGNGAIFPAAMLQTTSSGSLRSNSLVGGPTLAQ